jgi:hypothetical protein
MVRDDLKSRYKRGKDKLVTAVNVEPTAAAISLA